MNCKLFVQMVTGIPKLDALPSKPFVSEVDLVAGDVLKWGTGRHWAIYVGNGEIMEVEEWGAESRITPLTKVIEEIDPPDTVFSTIS
jgi:cell wall-associated NlpC family hydrolase